MTCLSPLGDSRLPYQCIYFNGASGTAPQQQVVAPDGAPEFCYIYIYDLFELCIRCAAPQQGVAATDGAPDFYFIQFIYFNFFESCISCCSTAGRQHQTGHQTSFFVICLFCSILIVQQVPLHNNESHHQTRHQNMFLFIVYKWYLRSPLHNKITRSGGARRSTRLFYYYY